MFKMLPREVVFKAARTAPETTVPAGRTTMLIGTMTR